jgi:hypothetical protein
MGLGSIEKLLDPYERKARLFPGLLVALPLGIAVLSASGSVSLLLKAATSLMIACGVPFLLSSITRDAGKKLEARLFIKWGGMPSTQLLRHTDSHFDVHTKRRYHDFLEAGTKVSMPSLEGEHADPVRADEAYRAAGIWLRSQTKNVKEFPHVFKENLAYGFRRNSTGLKYIGFFLALACLLALLVMPVTRVANAESGLFEAFLSGMSPVQALSIIISGIFTLVWATCFSEDSLRRTAHAYADRLIRSCDEMKKPRKARAALSS